MKIQGYHRWLLSYLPIFFSIISMLVFIFFLAISGFSKQQAIRANEIFTKHVMQALDSSLQLTEQIIVHELLTDDKFTAFYDPYMQMTAYQVYELSKKIQALATVSDTIDSIYLYRLIDNKVLTTKTMISLEQFDDRAFVKEVLEQPLPFTWSDERGFKDFGSYEFEKRVVSLVKRVPLIAGSQGIIVINVRTSAIKEIFNELSNSDISFLNLLDSKEQLFLGDSHSKGKELSRILSDYTGWTIKSGFKNKGLFDTFSLFSNMWIYLGVFIVAAGTFWMIVAIRRNYKPIESIRESIQQYALNKNMELSKKLSMNEFSFIEGAIENLMEQSNQYEEKYKENLMYRRKWFFQQVMEGDSSHNTEDWLLEIKKLGFSGEIKGMNVSVLEMDNYHNFREIYKHSDQQLLKFLITSLIKEMAEIHCIQVWSEWMDEERVGLLFSFTENCEDYMKDVAAYCEEVRWWIEHNLKFTVSFGIGGKVKNIQDISLAYDDALQALQYKTVLGSNRVLLHEDIEQLPQGQLFRYLDEIRLLAQQYRLGEDSWRQHLHTLLVGLQTAVSPRDGIVSLMNYVIYSLQKEMAVLSPEIQEVWNRESIPRLNGSLQYFEEIEGLEMIFTEILSDTAEKIRLLREKRINHKLLHQVKDYIELHFANPVLSLSHLSEEFHLNIKTLSRLFKEEFGEKFVDYLAKVRIENAKRLLKELPDESILDIALKVGYYNAYTFIRVFKKETGTTPGEYRK